KLRSFGCLQIYKMLLIHKVIHGLFACFSLINKREGKKIRVWLVLMLLKYHLLKQNDFSMAILVKKTESLN
ncbi:MAG: hypothetical protein ACLFQO_21375, partial [Cyclobacteriaceae bacterium]